MAADILKKNGLDDIVDDIIKNSDEAVDIGRDIVKGSDEAADIVKCSDKAANTAKGIAKNSNETTEIIEDITKNSNETSKITEDIAKNNDVTADVGDVGKAIIKDSNEGIHWAFSSDKYSPIEYKGTVTVGGEVRDVSRRVYQRNDIDFYYYDAKSKKTNLQRMLNGQPPIGSDGKPVELHHVIQKEVGTLVEIEYTTHDLYSKQLHGLIGWGESFRKDNTLKRQYDYFRRQYWIWRAKEFIEGVE